LMARAPKGLNRAGIGDVLSIHTGSFDWRLAAAAGEVEFVDEVAAKVGALVDEMEELADEINEVSDLALRFLIEAYAAENALCLEVGHSRPEEGSEHFFAYNVEHITGRDFIHGELVCLGVLLMSRLQDNRPERVERLLERTGVRYHPRDLDLSRQEVGSALLFLSEYVAEEGLFHTAINEREINQAVVGELVEGLKF